MKAEKYRDMGVNELHDEAESLSEQLFKLRLQRATGQLENVVKIREVRKNLARAKTVLNEKKKAEVAG